MGYLKSFNNCFLQCNALCFLFADYMLSNNRVKIAINYQTISPKDLAKSVLSEGGWSNLLVFFFISIFSDSFCNSCNVLDFIMSCFNELLEEQVPSL